MPMHDLPVGLPVQDLAPLRDQEVDTPQVQVVGQARPARRRVLPLQDPRTPRIPPQRFEVAGGRETARDLMEISVGCMTSDTATGHWLWRRGGVLKGVAGPIGTGHELVYLISSPPFAVPASQRIRERGDAVGDSSSTIVQLPQHDIISIPKIRAVIAGNAVPVRVGVGYPPVLLIDARR